ncbi:catabolic L-serine/threonine dehydratase [Entomophthora muscae]|uniref:Catabolic L-serine/threonine dehydratase n=1 Tax=Entomophthora muscae TaxID=34485 RepID=A0ACC2RG24_9FUNG|nr:catabolic L-serine/threonine dehydratase [Entomophthora muscae]
MIGSMAAPQSLSPSSPIAQKACADLPITPLLPSSRLSQLAGCQVFLKMEVLQTGGTHKIRGLLGYVADMVGLYGSDLHFVVGALPNMSIACAAAVAHYNQHRPTSCVTLSAVIPACSPPRFSQMLHTHGAKCIQFGQTWEQAKSHARMLVEKNQAQSIASLVMPPEDIVSGLTSIGQEIKQQIRPHLNNTHIDAILCPVGSGALLASLAHEFNQRTSVVGVETASTDLFHTCLVQKKMVFRPRKSAHDSLSLSDSSLCCKAIEAAKTCPVIPVVISEAMAANASLQFSEDHHVLIEAASGAALSPIYHELISGLLPDLQPTSTIVVVVTGGNLASLSDFARFAKHHSHPLIQAKSRDLFFLSLTPPSLISEEEKIPLLPQLPDLLLNSS